MAYKLYGNHVMRIDRGVSWNEARVAVEPLAHSKGRPVTLIVRDFGGSLVYLDSAEVPDERVLCDICEDAAQIVAQGRAVCQLHGSWR